MPEDQQGYEPPARDPGEPTEQLEPVPGAPTEQLASTEPRTARHRGDTAHALANPKVWLGIGAAVVVVVLALIALLSGDGDPAPSAAPSEPAASILPGAPGSTTPPATEPTDGSTSTDLPAPGRTLDTPQEAGGLVRILENELASAVDVSAFEDAGLRSGAVAAYAERGSDAPAVIFSGGTFIEPLPAGELEQAARQGLTATFGASALAMVGSDEFGDLTEHDAGPLGGFLFCTTVGGDAEGIPACGWVDEWTMGFSLGLAGTEDELAERLLAMRPDLEKEA